MGLALSRDAEADLARSVAQCGVLDAQLWAAREAAARAQRHRGELVGVLVGALADDALRDDYRDLARRTLARLAAEGAASAQPSAPGAASIHA